MQINTLIEYTQIIKTHHTIEVEGDIPHDDLVEIKKQIKEYGHHPDCPTDIIRTLGHNIVRQDDEGDDETISFEVD